MNPKVGKQQLYQRRIFRRKKNTLKTQVFIFQFNKLIRKAIVPAAPYLRGAAGASNSWQESF
jgi:hypothetical protein